MTGIAHNLRGRLLPVTPATPRPVRCPIELARIQRMLEAMSK